MIELGQLERRHADFEARNVRVVAASVEGQSEARQTQADFLHLLILADPTRGLSEAAGVLHPDSGPDGNDTSAPTLILVDRRGTVRWLYRAGEAITRMSPDDLLAAIEQHMH